MVFFNIEEEMMSFAQEESILSGLYFDCEAAMEEDTNIDDEANKQQFSNILVDKVRKLITEIVAMLDRLFSKIRNVIGRVMTTNKGFERQFREAQRANKPLEGIKLITYDYNDVELDRILDNVTKIVFRLVGSLRTSYTDEANTSNEHPMDMNKNDLYAHIFYKCNCPKDVTDLNTFYVYMKNHFRRQKREILFTANKTRDYHTITTSYDKIENDVNGKNTLMRQQVNILRSNLSNIIKNTKIANSIKKRAMKQATNASLLYNFYSSVLSMYIELKVEKILAYRIVLKKLYRI